jgi:hypothetical protein
MAETSNNINVGDVVSVTPMVTIPASLLEVLLQGTVDLSKALSLQHLPVQKKTSAPSLLSDAVDEEESKTAGLGTSACRLLSSSRAQKPSWFADEDDALSCNSDGSSRIAVLLIHLMFVLLLVVLLASVSAPLFRLMVAGSMAGAGAYGSSPCTRSSFQIPAGAMRPPTGGVPVPPAFLFRAT